MDPIKVCFIGTNGQSFGVWNIGGLELMLAGDAHDYVGKGIVGVALQYLLRQGLVFWGAIKRTLMVTFACCQHWYSVYPWAFL